MSKAYWNGVLACTFGKQRSENPYGFLTSDWYKWDDGWFDANEGSP